MTSPFSSSTCITDIPLWEKMAARRRVLSFELEITARCNLDCSHCYINLPAQDRAAQAKELTLEELTRLAGQAVNLGAFWCLLTGGEPLLRPDFLDLYLGLKRLGLLVSVFTNASLVTREHVELFRQYPPRDLEVTVYGVTRDTYEAVSRRPGSFQAFQRGLHLLLDSGLKVRLKAMALRANVHEFPEIARFCRRHTADYFRFDPFLQLRFDGDPRRNREIREQRLTPGEITALEQADPERFRAVEKTCQLLEVQPDDNRLFHCGAGNGSFTVSYDGIFRLCQSLWHPDCVADLRHRRLGDVWEHLVPRVRGLTSRDPEYRDTCGSCPLHHLCMWCPALAHLETGRLDAPLEYFCRLAQARSRVLGLQAPDPQVARMY